MPGFGGDDCGDLDECSNEGDGHTCTSTDQDADGFKVAAQCVNNDGSFTCNCDNMTGFSLQTGADDGSYCGDINECDGSPCPTAGTNEDGTNEVDQLCENTPGSYECGCPTGYEFAPGTTNCVDINECAVHEQDSTKYGCSDHSTCEDTDGSYVCNCDTGYEMIDNVCVDIDECQLENDCDENAICTDNDGSYTCACPLSNGQNPVPTGGVAYPVFNGDGRKVSVGGTGCTDINECAEAETSGSPEDHHSCVAPTLCENVSEPYKDSASGTWVGYNCVCGPGTTSDIEMTVVGLEAVITTICKDDDECTDGLHSCNTLSGSECENVAYGTGSAGPDGQQLGYRCSCPAGHRFESCDEDGNNCDELGDCTEIDQCDRNAYSEGTYYAHQCNELAVCENTGTYYACNCVDGTEHTNNIEIEGEIIDNFCSDINECTYYDMDANDYWQESVEYEGHSYGGCAEGSFDCCPQNSDCVNHIVRADGDSRMGCDCKDGFVADIRVIDGVTYNFCFDVLECTDADVCLQSSGDNLQLVCQEEQGSFSCKCPPGTEGEVVSGENDINTLVCNNVNECDTINPCGDNDGYNDGFGIECTDISNLATIARYSEDATADSDGQGFFFECSCKVGFQDGNENCRDPTNAALYPGAENCGYSCVNIDECADDNHGCDQNATCEDKTPTEQTPELTHRCGCNDGWTGGDGPDDICTGKV